MTDDRQGWNATSLDVTRRLGELRERDATAALATVVDVEGSAFRRPGAKMVLTPDGNQVGAITAGCLEAPVATLAEDVFEESRPVLQTFDLMDDDEWGLGLGCNGVIDVFVEPLDASLDEALAKVAHGESTALLTVVESEAPDVPVGARATITRDGKASVSSGRPPIPADITDDLSDRSAECATCAKTTIREFTVDGQPVRVFVDGIEPPPKLLVFGGQPDTVPVVKLARDVGFRVTVATARGGHADPERFPGADEVVATSPTDLPARVDGRTNVVLMTHNLLDDELALSALSETDVPYVGLMGPRERFDTIREDLQSDGVDFSQKFLDRVATPVGLDLGGGTPMEIALSIISEVVAVEHGRNGGRLRDREGPIHGDRNPVTET